MADLTTSFQQLWPGSGVILSSYDLEELRTGYSILFVRGYLSDPVTAFRGAYFHDQMHWLEQEGIAYLVATRANCGFDSEQLPARNATSLTRLITGIRSPKPVLIISHSKGGLDTLEMIVQHPDLLNRRVAGWISIQAPFGGTPVADWLTSNGRNQPGRRFLETVIGWVMQGLLGGDRRVLRTMRTDVRSQFLEQHAPAIAAACGKVPVLSFASWKAPSSSWRQDTWLKSRDYMKDAKGTLIQNDGLVPAESAVLRADGRPVGYFIQVEGIDHALPVMRSSYWPNFDRARFTQALLKVWLTQR